MMRILLLALSATIAVDCVAAESSCTPVEPLRIRVRFAGEIPREVQIESVLPSGFRLRHPATHEEIWSTGPGPANAQQVSGMDASFGTSFTAVHLDGDGVHDRLYAGDRAGRLWRFDLHSGAMPAALMKAAVLADLRATGGSRGFVAPPDVARIRMPSGESWLNVAIGTANTAAPRNDHRFYVLRDSIDQLAATPLLETDLDSLMPPAGVARGNARGYYLSLGSAQVLAQALTLNGRIHFTAVETSRNLLASCEPGALPDIAVPLSVAVLHATDGALETADQSGQGNVPSSVRRPISDSMPATAGVKLADSPDGATGVLQCKVVDQSLPGCTLDTRPQRSWWRREDAD
jgi:hypothetical protein